MKRALALCLVFVPALAHADSPPSVWDRARSPQAAEEYELHRTVRQRLDSVKGIQKEFAFPFRLAALERLRAEHAETSKNPLLRFDLGLAYFEVDNFPRAAQVLKAAIADFPTHPNVDEAWTILAFACGHIGDHLCERDAYLEVLRRDTEEPVRATPILNLAETQMHLGNLREATEGYREAIRIAEHFPPGMASETRPLATWGLAVALDRSGDRIAAEKEARLAIERSGAGLLRSNGVFFVPDYEVNYYEGLGAVARARVATKPRDAVLAWREAERSFTAYVRGSESAKPPGAGQQHEPALWLALAKARLADAKTQRERAEKAAKAAPREPQGAETRDTDL